MKMPTSSNLIKSEPCTAISSMQSQPGPRRLMSTVSSFRIRWRTCKRSNISTNRKSTLTRCVSKRSRGFRHSHPSRNKTSIEKNRRPRLRHLLRKFCKLWPKSRRLLSSRRKRIRQTNRGSLKANLSLKMKSELSEIISVFSQVSLNRLKPLWRSNSGSLFSQE